MTQKNYDEHDNEVNIDEVKPRQKGWCLKMVLAIIGVIVLMVIIGVAFTAVDMESDELETSELTTEEEVEAEEESNGTITSVEEVEEVTPYSKEIEQIDRNISDTFKGNNHKVEIEGEEGDYEVSITLDAANDRFLESIWCGINGLSFLEGMKEYQPELDKNINTYELLFFAEDSQIYSSKVDNSDSNEIKKLDLVSEESGEVVIVTTEDVEKFHAAKKEPEEEKKEPVEEAPREPEVSREFQNAQQAAEKYLAYSSFSKSGLYDQLLFEGYPEDAAQYAVDKMDEGVNWDIQALEKAKDYLEYSSFSDQGLYEQLLFEGFTEGQAQYAIDNLD